MQVTDAMVAAAVKAAVGVWNQSSADNQSAMRSALTAALAEMWRPISTPTDLPQDGMYIAANDHNQVAMIEARNGYRIVHTMPGFVDWAPVCNITAWQPLPVPPPMGRG